MPFVATSQNDRIYELYVFPLSIFQTVGIETLKDRCLDLSGID